MSSPQHWLLWWFYSFVNYARKQYEQQSTEYTLQMFPFDLKCILPSMFSSHFQIRCFISLWANIHYLLIRTNIWKSKSWGKRQDNANYSWLVVCPPPDWYLDQTWLFSLGPAKVTVFNHPLPSENTELELLRLLTCQDVFHLLPLHTPFL